MVGPNGQETVGADYIHNKSPPYKIPPKAHYAAPGCINGDVVVHSLNRWKRVKSASLCYLNFNLHLMCLHNPNSPSGGTPAMFPVYSCAVNSSVHHVNSRCPATAEHNLKQIWNHIMSGCLCVQQDWGLHIRAASQPSLYSTVGSFASHHFIIIIILNHSLHCTELSRAHRTSEATWVQFQHGEPVRRSCIKVLL